MIAIIRAYLVAAWQFFSDPAIDLNTDFAPSIPPLPRSFQVFVFDNGWLIYDVRFKNTQRSQQEIELLFIDAGFAPSEIDVTEIL